MIPNYKLKMDGLLLYNFWEPIITKILLKEDCIIDLLPQIHKKAYKKSDNSIDVEFKIKKNGNIIHSGHHGKFVKGKFIRFLCENQINDYLEDSLDETNKIQFESFLNNNQDFKKYIHHF